MCAICIHSFPAIQLHDKYVGAKEKKKEKAAEVSKLEGRIVDMGLGKKLAEWKVQEKEYLEKVVNMQNHKDLVNPYEPSDDKRESFFFTPSLMSVQHLSL